MFGGFPDRLLSHVPTDASDASQLELDIVRMRQANGRRRRMRVALKTLEVKSVFQIVFVATQRKDQKHVAESTLGSSGYFIGCS